MSLSLALLAPNFEHSLTMSLPPPFHAFTSTNPYMRKYLVLSPLSTNGSPPQSLVFPFLCCLSRLGCLSCLLFQPFPFVLCSFRNKFSFLDFFPQKRLPKNTATLFGLIPAPPLQHQRFPHHPPCVTPPHFDVCLHVSLPFLFFVKREHLDTFFGAQKVLAFYTPTKVPPTLPMLPPQPCVISPLSLNVLQSFPYL